MIIRDIKLFLQCFKAMRMTEMNKAKRQASQRNILNEPGRSDKEIAPGFLLNVHDGDVPSERTFVVMGSYRGGTSMVAGTLRLMGVFMGRLLGKGNNEDLDFQETDSSKIRKVVAERNTSLDVWGWKFPGSLDHIDEIVDDLRNPYFIVICRDPVAIAQRECFLGNYSANQALNIASSHQAKLLDFVFNCHCPVYLVSYERVMRQKEEFVRDLNVFTGLDLDKDYLKKISRYLVTGGGLTVSELIQKEELTEIIDLQRTLDIKEIKDGRQGLKQKDIS